MAWAWVALRLLGLGMWDVGSCILHLASFVDNGLSGVHVVMLDGFGPCDKCVVWGWGVRGVARIHSCLGDFVFG